MLEGKAGMWQEVYCLVSVMMSVHIKLSGKGGHDCSQTSEGCF